jgi:hypothetical protein
MLHPGRRLGLVCRCGFNEPGPRLLPCCQDAGGFSGGTSPHAEVKRVAMDLGLFEEGYCLRSIEGTRARSGPRARS